MAGRYGDRRAPLRANGIAENLHQMGMQPARYNDSVFRDAVKAKLLVPFRIKNRVKRILSPQ